MRFAVDSDAGGLSPGEHSLRRRQIRIDAVSALSPASLSRLRLSLPSIPSIFNALHDEFPGYPQHPISIRKHHVFQLFALHCFSIDNAYMALLKMILYIIFPKRLTII